MNLFEYDKNQGIPLLCGVDEAGRGPLAGDLYAAAVILPDGLIIEGLNDSKMLTAKKRDLLYDIIIDSAVAYGVGVATVAEIDEHNVLKATFLAMQRAVDKLAVAPKLVLVDGNQNPRLTAHCRCVVKGDKTSACIAAASILAKVTRDRYMEQVAKLYPQYFFEKHKGYGTPAHYAALDDHGISAVHRKTFLKKYLSGEKSVAKKRGDIGEQLATDYLINHGYTILNRNFHSSFGELDIVAKKDHILAIVEVKARKMGSVAAAREAVSRSKQEKIIKTTAMYMVENAHALQPRFDVIEIYFDGTGCTVAQLNHLESAFTGDGSHVFI